MNLIVGLGNPGNKYAKTLHNLGFMAVDAVAQNHSAAWQEFSKQSLISKLSTTQTLLLKPTTFMNESGRSVQEIIDYFKIDIKNVWVVHDELDLPPGTIRISFNASAAGHRGVQSIIDHLSSQSFWRFRLGIGRPPEPIPTEEYVLTLPKGNIKNILSDSLTEAVKLVKTALEEGIETAKLKNKTQTN